MMLLVTGSQSPQNLDRFVDTRFFDDHLLEAPRQSPVALDLFELVKGGRADDPELARREDRLDQRGQVHRAAGRRAGADRGVDLVDEQDRRRESRERADHRLEPLLEIAAKPGAGEERRRVEREHLRAAQLCGDVVLE